MQALIKYLTKVSHPPLPLGRWSSVTRNHDILEIKYQLKKEREKILKNGIDPYELNKVKKPNEEITSK
jgi:hypothetical protein